MTTPIYDLIMDELKDRRVYKYQTYAPFYIASFVAHRFNLMNQNKKIYYEAKTVPNMRLHLLFNAPPGQMKTFYLNLFGGRDNSILMNTGTEIVHRQSLNEASFIGTQPQQGQRRQGIAEEHTHSILMVDEFSGITQAMKSTYNNQLETALLAALDHGHVYKDMAATNFDYKTMLTLWSGVQPTRIDISSGLGRRFCYMLFVPDPNDNAALLDIKRYTRNMTPDYGELSTLWEQITLFKNDIIDMERIEFDESISDLYADLNLFSFETSIFDRIILGYSLAKNGADKHTTIGIFDNEIEKIVRNEKEWRDQIQKGVDFEMIIKIMKRYNGSMSMQDLVSECLLYSWNSPQVGSVVKAMIEANMLLRNRGMLELP